MNEQLEKDFLSKVDSLKDKTNILHFSCGSDAAASYLRLKEFGIKPILVYHYFIKGLPLHQNYLNWFEKKFNERVYQFPSTLFSEFLYKSLYQKPIKAREKFYDRIGYDLAGHTKEKFDGFLADSVGGDAVFHLGLKYTDGLRRYQHLIKNGCSHGDKFYPIASFQVKDIQAMLEKHDCLLPIDYRLWGISFESPRAWNINLIKENCPVTYKMILDWFPMAGAHCYRDKYTTLNKHFKQRVTQFGKYAMTKEMCKTW
jgi:hypothetical protein